MVRIVQGDHGATHDEELESAMPRRRLRNSEYLSYKGQKGVHVSQK